MAEAFWINPHGKQQEVSRHSFTEGEDYAVWLWLELHPTTGGKLIGSIDPSAGMGEFIGKWQVRLYLDGELIAQQVFFVAC